jgi:hypothetical protein
MKFPTEWKNNIMFQTTNQMQTSVTVTLPEVSVLGAIQPPRPQYLAASSSLHWKGFNQLPA